MERFSDAAMNSTPSPEGLFHEARAITDPRERAAFLERVCAADSKLRKRVDALLSADSRAGSFLEPRGAAPSSSGSALGLEQPGERIDRYRLLELIGEGGFGSVWMAEQSEPVRRRVALKILKLGMDTKAVVARFEAERQALALMDHASIAKVFDGGATASGRPYFVMELVKGVPITSYCDDARLGLRERLALFAEVCAALQHAHHKGVIHRDVKPSNVLVTLQDGRALPKVIDFGIAKATGAELTEKTLFTGFHQMLGTPDYMAPEQAHGGIDIDTRADVYSLGVLLYELLTGCKPLDLRAASGGGLAEVVRTIREQQPAKPSTRASTGGEFGDRAGVQRALAPRELSERLRGDLDWIVLKALEKDRARRYDTASALANDVERYLRDEPVLATPPSVRYLLAKYVRRHKGAVAAAAAIVIVLLAGIAASTAFALRAEKRREEASKARGEADVARKNAEDAAERASKAEREAQQRAAELEQVVAFQERQFEVIDAESVGLRIRESLGQQRRANAARTGADPAAVAAEVAKLQAELRGANLTTTAVDALESSIFEPSRRAIDEQFASQPLVRAALLERLAAALANLGRFDAASEHLAEVVALRERELGPEHVLTLDARLKFLALDRSALPPEVRAARLDEIASDARRLFGADHDLELDALAARATHCSYENDHAQSGQLFRLALEGWQRRGLEDDARALDTQSNLGTELIQLGRVEEGASELEAALAGFRRVFGERDRGTLPAMHSLGTAWMSLGRTDDALSLLRAGLDIARAVYGDDHTVTLGLIDNLAGNLTNLGRVEDAEPLFVELVERLRRVPGTGDVELHHALARFGRLRSAQRRYEDAMPLLREAYDGLVLQLPREHPVRSSCAHNLGTALGNLRRFAEAEPILREAYEGRRAALGDDHVDTATTAQGLASALHGLQQLDEAFEVYGRAVAALERSFGPDHDRVVRAWRNLGVIAMSRRDFESGANAFTKVADAVRRSGAIDGPDLHSDLALVATCLLELGRSSEAEAPVLECQSIRERILPAGHWGLAHIHSLLGGVRLGQGRLDEARALLVESAEQLLAAKDLPAPRPGQPDRAADAAERAAKLLDALESREPGAGHSAQAAQWRERALRR